MGKGTKMLANKELTWRARQPRRRPAGRTAALMLLLALACVESAFAADRLDFSSLASFWTWLGLPGLLGW